MPSFMRCKDPTQAALGLNRSNKERIPLRCPTLSSSFFILSAQHSCPILDLTPNSYHILPKFRLPHLPNPSSSSSSIQTTPGLPGILTVAQPDSKNQVETGLFSHKTVLKLIPVIKSNLALPNPGYNDSYPCHVNYGQYAGLQKLQRPR
jgi:hypothetical protein